MTLLSTDLPIFTTHSNYKPYSALEVNPKVFNPQKRLILLMKSLIWKARDV
jgi:hypothetical protein